MESHLFKVLSEKGMEEAIKVFYNFYPIQMVKQGSTIIKNLQMIESHLNSQKDEVVPKYTLSDFTIPEGILH
jgi:hypothetical protein